MSETPKRVSHLTYETRYRLSRKPNQRPGKINLFYVHCNFDITIFMTIDDYTLLQPVQACFSATTRGH